jgi:hypothetical protein
VTTRSGFGEADGGPTRKNRGRQEGGATWLGARNRRDVLLGPESRKNGASGSVTRLNPRNELWSSFWNLARMYGKLVNCARARFLPTLPRRIRHGLIFTPVSHTAELIVWPFGPDQNGAAAGIQPANPSR